MNAVEIEEAVSELAAASFDAAEFPFAFLAAFGNKETTVKRLRSGSSNASDVEGGVLQRSNIHIAVCPDGRVGETLAVLRASPKTASNRVKFILATDGVHLEAEDLNSGETVACSYPGFADHFGFFLPLAGISTVRAIKNNPIDIKATGRLNKLYVELQKDNPEWATEARRPAMNQFMARLIFCFFAEDTGIFLNHLFTKTIEQMSDSRADNTHEVLTELFRAMDTKIEDRKAANLPRWADAFPYVNGGLFTGIADCPRFSRIARSYLLRAAELNWQEINPDIFGSMIQAVADDEERGELGMHYTSVPNILKVLNPLFLDDLRGQLEAAGDNARKLRNLRKRLSSIRVFDPACGSGNFLVIAYIRIREIEHEIVKRTGDTPKSWVPLTNFYGIEIKGFAAEIARLSLLIAEFQCDVRMISQQEARLNVLPLHRTGQIRAGNALQVDWFAVCPTALSMERRETDLFGTTPIQDEIDFEAKEAETYICGNPPYFGSKWQSEAHKDDLKAIFEGRTNSWKSLDYVAGWFMKAADYAANTGASIAFVSTNSICQGQQVPILWPLVFATGSDISFAYTSFKWANLASRNAVVTVVVIGLRRDYGGAPKLYETSADGKTIVREVAHINAYLIPASNIIVEAARKPLNGLPEMLFGNMPRDAGYLLLTDEERRRLGSEYPNARKFLRRFQGSEDFTSGRYRGCIWIEDDEYEAALQIPALRERLAAVAKSRGESSAVSTRQYAAKPYRFVQIQGVSKSHSIIIPRHTSENREYLPVGINPSDVIIADSALAIYDAPIWTLSIIASRLHLVWIASVCGKIKTDYRYSNTIGWNTFPLPKLTHRNKYELASCAENILLARENNFPQSVSDLYEPSEMPEILRMAHDRNDETLERIYVGRRFRNDTERLEKLFELYRKMAAPSSADHSGKEDLLL
ncbi:MAG: class I SAM-dependent DNA methyltransferase [Mesorhizobium sp.]|uniref:class I SAM-dependent DNA methyltransferase n=1 Tax=Mesorhizobium sp. TaxID=1871066 RepID=UPI000FE50726|nr:DNA methyltransferase [Mesorhizobium sp.]RWA75348.1 MAG: class I SAM-dependent DNA methyltransferase [Mesorhizobium sp.]